MVLVLAVTLIGKKEHMEEMKRGIQKNAEGARKNEQGNLRFDISQAIDDPCKLFLYEVYRDEAALVEHTKTPHFQKWVKDSDEGGWLAVPMSLIKYDTLFFGDAPTPVTH